MGENKKLSEKDAERKERETLQRLLSTPPKPRTQKSDTDKPKKRGRPPKKEKPANE